MLKQSISFVAGAVRNKSSPAMKGVKGFSLLGCLRPGQVQSSPETEGAVPPEDSFGETKAVEKALVLHRVMC